jgi:hypothetical protein
MVFNLNQKPKILLIRICLKNIISPSLEINRSPLEMVYFRVDFAKTREIKKTKITKKTIENIFFQIFSLVWTYLLNSAVHKNRKGSTYLP